MVYEAHGGSWEAGALDVWKKVTKAMSLVTGESPGLSLEYVLQTLSVAVQRANAKAILLRAVEQRGTFRSRVEC